MKGENIKKIKKNKLYRFTYLESKECFDTIKDTAKKLNEVIDVVNSISINIDPKSIEVKDMVKERDKLEAMKQYLVENDMALVDKQEAMRILGWYWKAKIVPSPEDMDLYMRLNGFVGKKFKDVPPTNTPYFSIKSAVRRKIGDSEYVDLVIEDNVGQVFVTTIALGTGVQITLEGKKP